MFDHIYSDISQRGWREDPRDLDLIEKHARVFSSFYAVPTLLPRRYIAEVRDFVGGITFWFRWLSIALLDATGDLLHVFDEWLRWHADRGQDVARIPIASFLRYVLPTISVPSQPFIENMEKIAGSIE